MDFKLYVMQTEGKVIKLQIWCGLEQDRVIGNIFEWDRDEDEVRSQYLIALYSLLSGIFIQIGSKLPRMKQKLPI